VSHLGEIGSAEAMLSAARRILGVPDLTEADDLFDTGMTSLLALKLADELSAITGRDVTVADVYDAGTVAQIGRLVCAGPAPQWPSTAPAVAASTPLSHAQQRFWIAEQLTPAAADNLLVLGYAITGPLSVAVLRRALDDVAGRHAALRTYYPLTAEGIAQAILPAGGSSIPFDLVDAPGGPPGLDSLAALVTADWWNEPLAIDQQPPLRVRLCELGPDRHLLCLQIHHIAFDGRSEQLFLDDLSACYRGAAASLPPVAGYDDYARWEHATGSDQAAVEFWRRTLASVPPPFLPAPPEPADEATRLELVRSIPATSVHLIQTVTRRHRAPAVTALLAATARASAQVFAVADVCLGTVTDRRSRATLTSVIGYFINPVAVPLTAVAERSTADLLDHAAAAAGAAFRHSQTPFDELVDLIQPERGRHPWFQAWVVLQYPAPRGELSPGTTLEPVPIRPPRTSTELSVEAFPQHDGSWELRVGWREDIGDQTTMAGLADALVAALTDVAALGRSPDARTARTSGPRTRR
jgi:hypothetical protein